MSYSVLINWGKKTLMKKETQKEEAKQEKK